MEKLLTMTRPAVGTISPVSSLIMVDLPDPEGPTKKDKVAILYSKRNTL